MLPLQPSQSQSQSQSQSLPSFHAVSSSNTTTTTCSTSSPFTTPPLTQPPYLPDHHHHQYYASTTTSTSNTSASLLSHLRDLRLLGHPPLAKISCAPRLAHLRSGPSHAYSIVSRTSSAPVRSYAADFASKAIGSRFLAIGDEEGMVHIVNTDDTAVNPTILPACKFPAHNNTIFDIQWHPHLPRVCTASGDRSAMLWDVATGSPLALFAAHDASVRSIAFCNADPHLLVSGARDGHVCLWDLRCTGVATSHRGCTAYGAANLIRNAHHPLQSQSQHGARGAGGATVAVASVVFLHPKSVVSAGVHDGCLRTWDLRHHGSYHRTPYPTPTHTSIDLTLTPQRQYGLRHLVLHKDQLLVLGMNGRVYAVQTGLMQPTAQYASSVYLVPSHYTRLSVDALGRFLCVGSVANVALVIELATHRTFVLDQAHQAEVTQVCFSKSSLALRLATCADDACVRLWNEDDVAAGMGDNNSDGRSRVGFHAREVPADIVPWSFQVPSSAGSLARHTNGVGNGGGGLGEGSRGGAASGSKKKRTLHEFFS